MRERLEETVPFKVEIVNTIRNSEEFVITGETEHVSMKEALKTMLTFVLKALMSQ